MQTTQTTNKPAATTAAVPNSEAVVREHAPNLVAAIYRHFSAGSTMLGEIHFYQAGMSRLNVGPVVIESDRRQTAQEKIQELCPDEEWQILNFDANGTWTVFIRPGTTICNAALTGSLQAVMR